MRYALAFIALAAWIAYEPLAFYVVLLLAMCAAAIYGIAAAITGD